MEKTCSSLLTLWMPLGGTRYENGAGYELRPFDPQFYKRFSHASPNFYTFYGYSVLVYLNGSRDDVDSHTGSSRDVVGGETHAFYSRQHGGKSKQHIAKVGKLAN